MIDWKRRPFQNLSKSTFIRDLSLSTPWIWYAGLFAKPRGRYQPLRANSKVDNWHSSSPLRWETAVAGPSILAAATSWGWSDNHLQDFHGPFGYWSELDPPSYSTLPKRAPLQGTPRLESPPKKRVGIFREVTTVWACLVVYVKFQVSVKVVKYCKKVPSSVLSVPSVNIFTKRLAYLITAFKISSLPLDTA